MSHGKPRIDNRRVVTGIMVVNRNRLRRRDASGDHVMPQTLYKRWSRRGETGVVTRIMEGMAAADAEQKTVMIGAICQEAHRTASSVQVEMATRVARLAALTWA